MALAGCARPCSLPSRGVAVRSFSATARAADEEEDQRLAGNELSEYRNRRRDRLNGLQGKEGLFREAFPRLEHRTPTMLVSEFLKTHKDVDALDKESDPVTLYGMLLCSVCAMSVA
ncbi:hypothetical protein IMZ48_04090 [Candidatus Bathyarchaeota archaeon]|nr:hypothetical protein [Candidatus Bathyarchaeota archaeon]